MANLLVVILEDLEKLPDLMAAWKRIGVPGVTLLHSVGGYKAEGWLRRMGLGGLGRLLEGGEITQRTLLSVIEDDDLLEQAIAEADEVVDGFDRPHSGILFVVPVSRALGLRKWTEREAKAPAEASQPPRPRLDQTVADIMAVLRLTPIVVHVDDSLEKVVRSMLTQPQVQVVAVVNEVDRLVGLIDVFSLADAFLLTFFPEAFLSHMTELEQVEEFARRTHIKQASDIMQEPAWVHLNDSIADAFRILHERKLSGIPVVDEHYHVTGYISLLELMGVCANTLPKEGDQ